MIATVAAHNIFRDWATYVSLMLAWAGGGSLVYIRLVKPARDAHRTHEKERTDLHAENTMLKGREKAAQTQGIMALCVAALAVAWGMSRGRRAA